MMDKVNKKIITDTMNKKEGFIFSNNYELVEVNDDYCIIDGKITDSSYNPFGFAHGGYIFGLADTCAGVLASTDGRAAVTTNGTILYIKKATGNKIIAKAVFLKKGKALSNIEVEIKDDENNLISKVIFEYFYI